MTDRLSIPSQCAAILLCAGLLLGGVTACGWAGHRAKPAWVEGNSAVYPAGQYLLGVGQAEMKSVASERAYAAVARIFKAEVSAQAKDWESYLVIEGKGQTNAERRLTLDHVTQVSTDKVLENVQVLDSWYDAGKGQHYVLAGMNRAQAETAMAERLRELDREIDEAVSEARRTQDKVAKVRNLRRAAKTLVLREAYNADLRVIRPSGQGSSPPYRVSELTAELEQFLASNLIVAVEVTGEQAEPVQRALIEGLIREGLRVTGRAPEGEASPGAEGAVPAAEVLVTGVTRVWLIDAGDPRFRYARWCSDFAVYDLAAQRIVGAISRGGKEGHLSDREATAKAVRVMQQEFSNEVAKAIAAHIYGESELPASAALPAGCPREDRAPKPGALHIRPL